MKATDAERGAFHSQVDHLSAQLRNMGHPPQGIGDHVDGANAQQQPQGASVRSVPCTPPSSPLSAQTPCPPAAGEQQQQQQAAQHLDPAVTTADMSHVTTFRVPDSAFVARLPSVGCENPAVPPSSPTAAAAAAAAAGEGGESTDAGCVAAGTPTSARSTPLRPGTLVFTPALASNKGMTGDGPQLLLGGPSLVKSHEAACTVDDSAGSEGADRQHPAASPAAASASSCSSIKEQLEGLSW